MALLAGMIIMLVFAAMDKEGNDQNSNEMLTQIFADKVARIRKYMPVLALMGGLIAAGTSMSIMAGDPISLGLLAEGDRVNAGLTALARAIGFIPLVATTAITTGVYAPAGMTFVFVIGLLIPNPFIALIAGGPARFYVKRIIRPKYRLADGRIITAPMPVMAHPHSNASESVLAHIATAKYYDHLPLHRQLDIFEREGIHLSPSTVSNWMMAAAQRLEPIYNELRELVKDSYYVMADETPHPVLESDRPGALHRGYMWNFYLPRFHTPFFEYHKGRGSSGIDTLLAGQVRVVQSDGFAVYDKFDTLPGKLHLCCWAHVRRNFVEAEGNDPPRARHALGQIGGLYAVEEKIRMEHLEGEAVVKLRREKSYPIIKELEKWCKEEYGHTVDKSPIAKAMSPGEALPPPLPSRCSILIFSSTAYSPPICPSACLALGGSFPSASTKLRLTCAQQHRCNFPGSVSNLSYTAKPSLCTTRTCPASSVSIPLLPRPL